MTTASTVESLLVQISNVLAPLERDLAPGRARATLAAIGIPISAAQEAAIAGPLQDAVGAVRDMLQLSGELLVAIEAENIGAILSKSLGLVTNLVTAIESLDDVKTAVDGLGLALPPGTVDTLPERLFNLMLVRYLDETARGVNELLALLGILERTVQNPGAPDEFVIAAYRFARVGAWLESPGDVAGQLYGWGQAAFDGIALLDRLEDFLQKINTPAFFDAAAVPPTLDVVLLQVRPRTDISPKGISIGLGSTINPGTITVQQDDWKVDVDVAFQLPFETELIVQPDGRFTFVPPSVAGPLAGAVTLTITADRTAAAEAYQILGVPGGSRLEARKFVASLGGRFTWDGSQATGDVEIGGAVSGGRLEISFAEGDGFLSKILAGIQLRSDFDLGFGYSTADGLFFVGSTTLEIQLPLHLTLGPVEISGITFSIGIDGQTFPVTVAADIKAALGPLVGVVENIGVKADVSLKDDRSGNAGPVDIAIGFKPPNGVGLGLDVGVVRGGGYLYFDLEKQEYAGALELAFVDLVTLKAIGLINTRMPDGSPGFSLLIIISAEFTPVQLGYGFTLNGVGGLLGLNRTVVLDALRDGVRTGAVNSIMFPTNIIENAPRIISDLRIIFPVYEGRFLIGPMVQIGWGTPSLVTLSLGLIIEIPGNIAIVGILKVVLPHEEAALVFLQVNFVGTVDFDKKMLTFDASLFESRIVFVTLEGDMVVRLRWGDDPGFLLSVGGFHPSFTPPPMAIPTLRRISATILAYPYARIRLEAYHAVTSNTVQIGAHADLFFGFDDLNVSGHIGFDALFRFSPFYFIAEVSGRMSLEVIGVDCMSVRLRFSLEGPSPYRAKGSGSVSILFWDIDVDFDVTWGEERTTTLPPILVLPLITGEVRKRENWQALPPASSSLLVSLRELPAELLVLHPVGTLTIRQRAMPLDLTLDRIGSQTPSDVNRVTMSAAKSGATSLTLTTVTESFAPAQFQNMSDADKLSRPSYQKMNAGVTISTSGDVTQSSHVVKRKIEYEVTLIDVEPRPATGGKLLGAAAGLFFRFLRGNAAAKSPLSKQTRTQLQPFADKVAVASEGYTVAFSDTNRPIDGSATFASEAMAFDYMRQQVGRDPNLQSSVHVIASYEVARL